MSDKHKVWKSGTRCPRCKRGGFTMARAAMDDRPRFTCSACKETWTCGRSGGPYRKFAQPHLPPPLPSHPPKGSAP